MSRILRNIAFCSYCLFFCVTNFSAQSLEYEEHLQVTMRMIGHRVLLHAGDSTSLVLPIDKEGDKYGIHFDTTFDFNPESLESIIDSVMREANVSNHYFVTVQYCDSNAIVYSYEKVYQVDTLSFSYVSRGNSESMVPCISRVYPKNCYDIFITIIPNNQVKGEISLIYDELPEFQREPNYVVIIGSLLLLLGVVLMLLFRYKKRNRITPQPGLISIGDFLFDTRSTELTHNNEKTELSGKEANLLILLYNNVNVTVEKEVILNKVWGDEGDYVGRTLDVFISKLRKKLEADPSIKIVNIRGVGYKLIVSTIN